MIGHSSEKIKDEWDKASVALRLVVEALDQAHGGATFVFRLNAPTRFESGVHSTGLACDVELRGRSSHEISRICCEVNRLFPIRGPGRQVCTLMDDPTNLPGGKRLDVPHVHVQISFDWKHDPRAFLRAHGYLQSTD